MVSTLDFESSDLGSTPGRTFSLLSFKFFINFRVLSHSPTKPEMEHYYTLHIFKKIPKSRCFPLQISTAYLSAMSYHVTSPPNSQLLSNPSTKTLTRLSSSFFSGIDIRTLNSITNDSGD